MYSEIKPSIELKDSLENFWIFSNNKLRETFKVCPDTCTDLIFDLNLNKVFLSAAMTNYQRREVPARSNLVGIRFKSENFGSFLGVPLNEFKNLRIEISELLPRFNSHIVNELKGLETKEKIVKKLEDFIVGALSQNMERRDELVISAANRIRLLKGNFIVKDLASSQHISLRQLQRRFKQYIGLTIKEFSNIIRFKHAENSIKSNPELSFMEIAFEAGYYDHAHMNSEFNRISGENPSSFR